MSCFNDNSVNSNPKSIRLKSKWQRINIISFSLHDNSTPLVGVVFKHYIYVYIYIYIRTVLKKLTWWWMCFVRASLILQCTFKFVSFSQQRCSCICFQKILSSRFTLDLLLSHLNLLISIASLIFLLLYLVSLHNIV